MLVIPLESLAAQTFTVNLANQFCQIDIYQKATGLFCNLYVSNTLIIGGVICENLNRIVRSVYLGFIGDLCFVDLEGNQDPNYTGLGSRYLLLYLEAADLDGIA